MRHAGRKLRNVCGAVCLLVLAVLCAAGTIWILTTTPEISIFQKLSIFVLFSLTTIFLAASGVGLFRRVWRKDREEEKNDG